MRTLINGKSLTSVAHRFAAFRKFRPRLTSLKRVAYCKRHTSLKLGAQCAYAELLRSYRAFLLCTYSSNSIAKPQVQSFVDALDALVAEVERVHSGQAPAVRGRVVAAVGRTSTELRKALKGTTEYADCRRDWEQFGYAYHTLFRA